MPEVWTISRVCQEFGCVPSVAIREMEELPANLLWQIIDVRAYAQGKEHYERQQQDPDGEIDYDLAEWIEKIQAEAKKKPSA